MLTRNEIKGKIGECLTSAESGASEKLTDLFMLLLEEVESEAYRAGRGDEYLAERVL